MRTAQHNHKVLDWSGVITLLAYFINSILDIFWIVWWFFYFSDLKENSYVCDLCLFVGMCMSGQVFTGTGRKGVDPSSEFFLDMNLLKQSLRNKHGFSVRVLCILNPFMPISVVFSNHIIFVHFQKIRKKMTKQQQKASLFFWLKWQMTITWSL